MYVGPVNLRAIFPVKKVLCKYTLTKIVNVAT